MITIILGTAHQKSIQGKSSPDGKFKEYKYSREICKAVCDILQSMGYRTIIDIEDDDLGLSQSRELSLRCSIVNELVKQVYTSVGKTKSDELATCLYNAAKYNAENKKMRTDYSDGDPDKEAHLYVLKHTNCPAVLTENFFQDNQKDVDYLTSDEGFHAIVRLHVEGILNYMVQQGLEKLTIIMEI